VLDDEAAGPGADGLEHVLVELEGGEDDDAHLGQPVVGGDRAGGGQAVGARHADVHEHDVGPLPPGELHRLLAVTGLADHRDVVLGVEQRPEARPHQVLVIGEQHPDHRAPSCNGNCARTR
jgi:hypothetical protein